MNMQDKAEEIIKYYESSTGHTTRVQKTPGKPKETLEKHEGDPIKHKQYREILGKLMFYVTKISPECSYSCGQLARQMHNPGPKHWDAMGRIIGYLKGKEHHERGQRISKSFHSLMQAMVTAKKLGEAQQEI